MFEAGELVMYGSTGICRVLGVKTPDLPGADKSRKYYMLDPLYQSGTIYAPVDSDKVFVRRIISTEEAERLIEWIPTVKAEAFHSQKLHQLADHYRTMMLSHDCADLVELTMSIYAKKQDAIGQNLRFGQVDERFMKRAEELLFGELAAALDIPRDEVQAYITRRIDEAQPELTAAQEQ